VLATSRTDDQNTLGQWQIRRRRHAADLHHSLSILSKCLVNCLWLSNSGKVH
jgi:hypothetical protein